MYREAGVCTASFFHKLFIEFNYG